MCNSDSCRHYNTNWMCPPACGTLEECAAKAVGFKEGIIVQSVGYIEDSFDIESTRLIENQHKKHFQILADVLSAGLLPCLGSGRRCLQPGAAFGNQWTEVVMSREIAQEEEDDTDDLGKVLVVADNFWGWPDPVPT
jgi:hypothetical protein